jgi:hypothetical protein
MTLAPSLAAVRRLGASGAFLRVNGDMPGIPWALSIASSTDSSSPHRLASFDLVVFGIPVTPGLPPFFVSIV